MTTMMMEVTVNRKWYDDDALAYVEVKIHWEKKLNEIFAAAEVLNSSVFNNHFLPSSLTHL